MSTTFRWSARLMDADGGPVSGAVLEVQLFDLKANAWLLAANAITDADGLAKGSGAIEDDTPLFAPALRLVEDDVVMSVAPEMARAARGTTLTIDFGEVRRLAVAARFAQPRTVRRGLRGAPMIVGGVAPSGAAQAMHAKAAAALAVSGDELSAGYFEARLAEQEQALEARDKALADRAFLLAQQDKEIAQLRATVAEKEGALLEATSGGKAINVTDFAKTVAKQLDRAQTSLQETGFSLGAIQVHAKGLLRGDGGRIELLDKTDLNVVPVRALSDIKLDFQPSMTPAASAGIHVPDVRELTESAARRVLASVGLALDASTGARGLYPSAAAGQAVLQSPAAGEKIARGARVMVIFAGDDKQGQ